MVDNYLLVDLVVRVLLVRFLMFLSCAHMSHIDILFRWTIHLGTGPDITKALTFNQSTRQVKSLLSVLSYVNYI